jgi:hypothetical protein
MVAAVQSLINRGEAASLLFVDGVFGPLTEEGVRRARSNARLPVSGVVDGPTWNALTAGQRLAILSANDIYDPAHEEYTPRELRGPGLIRTGGMSGGVGHILAEVGQRARTMGRIILLRFYGHGRGGLMAVSAGTGGMRDSRGELIPNAPRPDHAAHQSIITTANFRAIEEHLRRLRPLFAPFGSIEFHGCRVGRGAEGRRLLEMTVHATGVPASAGIGEQSFGPQTAFRFEGAVRTVYPGGQSLKQWARAQTVV